MEEETTSVFQFADKNVLDQQCLRDLINTVYTYYNSYGEIPTLSDLERRTPYTREIIENHIDNSSFQGAMDSRGVPWKKPSRMDSRQMILLTVLTNPTDKRDLDKKLKACKVTYGQFRSWMQQPLFKATLDDYAAKALKDNMAAVDIALLSTALKGNLPAIQYYHQITGRFDPNRQSQMEVSSVLNRVVEIIAQNVKDPAALNAIGDSIQSLAIEAGLMTPSPVAAYETRDITNTNVTNKNVTNKNVIEGKVVR